MAKRTGTNSLSEWTCAKHGFVLAKDGAGKKEKPMCRWCGTPLTRDTWTLSSGR